MSERILVCVAWPYANGPLHVGHMAGCYLPADIFARYHRMKGNEVLMVSGSDQHGTPVTIKAEAEGKTPNQVVDVYHQEFLDTWRRFGITFDLFTTTGTANHAQVAQDFFLKLLEKDYIYKDTVSQAFCEKCQRFLPDRYVEGTCPNCKSPRNWRPRKIYALRLQKSELAENVYLAVNIANNSVAKSFLKINWIVKFNVFFNGKNSERFG